MKNAKKNNNNNKPPQSNRMFQGGAADSLSAKIDRVLARIPKGSFTAAGSALGGPVGAAAGATLAKISGYGDYVVTHNTIATRGGVGATDIVPNFTGKGGVGSNVRITHREYVGDVKAPEGGGFTVKQYAISPTNDELFPWLSDFARKFQRYKIHGMAAYYKSTSTDYNNSGIIAMTINYDPADPKYLTMQGMMNSKFAVSTKPSQHIAAPVECAPSESPQAGYFIDHGVNLVGAELRQTCKGMLNIGMEGLSVQPGTSVGQLYIVYDIELMYPYHSLANSPHVPFGASGAYFNDVTDDVEFAGLQVPFMWGLPSTPEDRLLYTSYYPVTTGPHRIDIQGTPGAMKFQFQQAGKYLILCNYKNQTVAMAGVPTGVDCIMHDHQSIATIGNAESNKCAWASCVVTAAAGGVLTWWDTSYDGQATLQIYADKLS
jgi:hypothetical protein